MGKGLSFTGEYVERALEDKKHRILYFAPPGKQVPKAGSDYVAGTGIALLLVVLWVVAAVVAVVLNAVVDRFPGLWVGLYGPVLLLILFSLAAPFLRRRSSAEGRLLDRVRRGEIVFMRRSRLGLSLLAQAQADRTGY